MSDNTSTAKNRKQNHNKSGKSQQHKADLKAQAEERKAARDKKTKAQQIAELDMLFGVGLGAVKERARLNRVEAPKEEKPEVKEKDNGTV